MKSLILSHDLLWRPRISIIGQKLLFFLHEIEIEEWQTYVTQTIAQLRIMQYRLGNKSKEAKEKSVYQA